LQGKFSVRRKNGKKVPRFIGFVAAHERAGVAVGDVALGDLERTVRHDLMLDEVLDLFDRGRAAKQENSNKNPVVNSTQRDYMAGEVSRDLTNRILLPEVAMLQAVAKECGRSMSVPVMTVPFCSISSRFTRSQLCMCWA